MIRRIIKINQKKCNGCGACASACHEGAIEMINGKAVLTREDYCDGLGDCLPACPTGAITFEEREALSYDEAAVARAKEENKEKTQHACHCPGTHAHSIKHSENENSAFAEPLLCGCPGTNAKSIKREDEGGKRGTYATPSRLMQWPCQIKLVPTRAPYFDGANLLIAADCTAYAYGNFHNDFIRNHITVVGCPKLDAVDYAEKLTEIIRLNDIKSVKIVRMEVPCCSGIEMAAKRAIRDSGKFIPWQVVTVSTDGKIIE